MAGTGQGDATTRTTQGTDLRDDAAALLSIIRTLPDVIFRCERHDDGRIYFSLNEGRLAEEFHVTTDEIRGVPLDQMFGGASDEIMAHFNGAFEGDETEFLNEIGGRWFKHHPQPVRDDGGNIVAVVGFITEVTELVRAQEQIQHLTEDLTKKLIETVETAKQLEAFSYTLSHDLRTPMSVIAAQCDVLQRTLPQDLSERTTAGIDRMQNAVRRMNRLIEDMLALSRATRAPLELNDVRFSDVAMDVVAELRESEPGRRVVIDVAPDLHARGDASLVRQVLQNLIGNAWKYTGKTEDARIRVYAEETDGGRAFVVADNGVGFDMHDAGLLFEPFQRLHAAKDFQGSGVGLATVYKIVHRHGGRVWAEAEPGKGATFRFTLGTRVDGRSADALAATA